MHTMLRKLWQKPFRHRIRTLLQGVTGVVFIAFGVRLAFEQE